VDQTPPCGRQDNLDQSNVQQSILPLSLLARYKDVLDRRRDEQASGRRSVVRLRAQLKVIAGVFWALFAILAAISAWRATAFVGRLSAYIRFVQSGIAVQATVIDKRSTEKTSQYNPHRYAITYGFWVGKRRIIRIEGVSQQTYEAQYVDDPVTVLYLPNDPWISIIKSELLLPWPVEPGIALALCIASLVTAYRTTKRVKSMQVGPAPPT
jgi:hypothetical protein